MQATENNAIISTVGIHTLHLKIKKWMWEKISLGWEKYYWFIVNGTKYSYGLLLEAPNWININ